MKHIDVQDELAAGFSPSPLPPMGPDGGLELPQQRVVTSPPPRLCEQGPCVNYHCMKIQLDAARPMADRYEDGGRLVGSAPAQPFHIETHHYCYPTSGVETELGDLPVIECNRWTPLDAPFKIRIASIRDSFLRSEEGKTYTAELEAWKTTQGSSEVVDVDQLVAWVAMHVTDSDAVQVFTLYPELRLQFEMAAAEARDVLDLDYLRGKYGPGRYRVQTRENADLVRMTITVEVQP